MAKIISVVSGKGGAGKSLLTAVMGRALAREGQQVLLVDMDIFVRGLTVLLFGYTKLERATGRMTVSDLLGVSYEQSENKAPMQAAETDYMIRRFFECDVLPAVDNIGAPLDYDDRSLSDAGFCNEVVSNMLKLVNPSYDYIFLDNRAGMDSLVAASCKKADIVLTVAEDDEVARQTNVNLVRFLQTSTKVRMAYTILNKGRNIKSYEDLRDRSRLRSEFTMLGVIPFDIEVLEDFGSQRFWTTIFETLYFRAFIDAWNALAKLENVTEILESHYRFAPKIFMRSGEGRFSLFERMLRIYSFVFLIGGIGAWLFEHFASKDLSRNDIISIASIMLGVISLIASTSGFQVFLKGQAAKSNKSPESRD